MSKVVIYTLNADGSVPDFVINGGHFAAANGNAAPQDLNLVGEVADDAPGDALSVQSLADYLTASAWSGDQTPLEAAALLFGDTGIAESEKAARENRDSEKEANIAKVPVLEAAVDDLIVAVVGA